MATPQYIYQSHYGHAGEGHTMRPQFVVKEGGQVHATRYNTEMKGGKALYQIRDDKWYATKWHPEGESKHALFETRGNQIFTTRHNPDHNPIRHAFETRAGSYPLHP